MDRLSYQIKKYSATFEALDRGTEAGILETCIIATREAVSLAPEDEGRLKNSIMYKTTLSKSSTQGEPEISPNPQKLEGYVGSALNYSIYQEFGTRKMKPHPFLRPAIAIAFGADRDDIIRRVREETARGIRRQGRKVETFR